MEIREALELLRKEFPADEIGHSDTVAKHGAEYLDAFRKRVNNDEDYEFTDGEAAALFRMCEEMRAAADFYERDLLRTLKWGGEGLTWQAVAEAVDGQLGGRQAMQKRWNRLTAATRRTTTGDMRRGAAAVNRRDGSVDDTTTAAE